MRLEARGKRTGSASQRGLLIKSSSLFNLDLLLTCSRTAMQASFESIVAQSHCSFAYRAFKIRGFPFRWHFHPEYELTLIVSGEGRRFVGDDISDFAAGDLVLLGRNLPHTWHSRASEFSSPPRSHAVCIQFADDFLGAGFFATPELNRVRRLLNAVPWACVLGGGAKR